MDFDGGAQQCNDRPIDVKVTRRSWKGTKPLLLPSMKQDPAGAFGRTAGRLGPFGERTGAVRSFRLHGDLPDRRVAAAALAAGGLAALLWDAVDRFHRAASAPGDR
jgi:hypothetical protein